MKSAAVGDIPNVESDCLHFVRGCQNDGPVVVCIARRGNTQPKHICESPKQMQYISLFDLVSVVIRVAEGWSNIRASWGDTHHKLTDLFNMFPIGEAPLDAEMQVLRFARKQALTCSAGRVRRFALRLSWPQFKFWPLGDRIRPLMMRHELAVDLL